MENPFEESVTELLGELILSDDKTSLQLFLMSGFFSPWGRKNIACFSLDPFNFLALECVHPESIQAV